jgi:hypothetical protein
MPFKLNNEKILVFQRVSFSASVVESVRFINRIEHHEKYLLRDFQHTSYISTHLFSEEVKNSLACL